MSSGGIDLVRRARVAETLNPVQFSTPFAEVRMRYAVIATAVTSIDKDAKKSHE